MKIIVLTVMPASGKSTIAKKLSAEFNMPILEKDALKEELFDTLGFNCYAEKRKLDIAANAVLLNIVDTLLSQNIPMIIDNNFDTESQARLKEILERHNCTAITVFFGGETDALIEKISVLLNAKSDIPPFRMHDNIYFVGARKVCVHIIKTEVGLVMIDTGYPDMGEQIKDSMHLMGLDFKDICAIFHSHGHFDHYGCTVQFKEETGAKTYISRIDNEIVNGTLKHLSCEREPLPNFDCDVLVEDGDVFTFGSTTIRCVLTAGHSPGVLSFFIETGSGENRIVAAMHGGVGMNSLKASWFNKHNLSFEWRDIFREGLHKVFNEHVDLVLGNHTSQNNTKGKLQQVLNGESILDKSEWQRFLLATEAKLDALIEEEKTL